MWFTDNPWPPIAIFGMLAVGFVSVWYSQKRAVFLMAAGGMGLLAVGTFFSEQYIITDEEVVELEVYKLTAAFQRLDIPATLELVSAGAKKPRNLIKQGGAMVDEIPSMRITDVSVELLADGSRAKTHFRANGVVEGLFLNQPVRDNFSTRWLLTWQREEGVWKVIDVKRLHPIRDDHIDPFSAN